MPRCSFRQDRRVLVPCFSSSHSPAPQSFRPVLSTSRWTASPSLRGRGGGTSSVSARRHRVVWSGRQSQPEQVNNGADQPFCLAQGQAKHGPQGQRRQDRQSGVPGLPTWGGAWRCAPPLNGLLREPHCQAPTLAQAGIVLAPVHHLSLL